MANRSASNSKDQGMKKKGQCSLEEDNRLISYIKLHGEGHWDFVGKASGLMRSGRSCRLRWVNYLRSNVNHTRITPDEERLIIHLHAIWGNRWSWIAQSLPGRTDNSVKNFWRTRVEKRNHLQGSDTSCMNAKQVYFECLNGSSSLETLFPSPVDSKNNNARPSDIGIFPSQTAEDEEVPSVKVIKESQQHLGSADAQYAWTQSSFLGIPIPMCDVIYEGIPIPICDTLYEFESNEEDPDTLSGFQSSLAFSAGGLSGNSTDLPYNFSRECLNTITLSGFYADGKIPYSIYSDAPSPHAFSLPSFIPMNYGPWKNSNIK